MTDFDFEKLGLKEAPDYLKFLIPQNVEIPKPESVFDHKGVSLFTRKSISLLTAKAKAGKTSVAAYVVAKMLIKGIRVLWVDTEQGSYYGSRTQFWVLSIAFLDSSDNLLYFDFKTLSPNERIEAIEQILHTYKVDVLVIDGIRDLVSDINSPDQATNISTYLMQWAEIHDCHIINILHQNKGDNNARGHLGSELVNKAETVLKVETDANNQIIVSPEFSRGLAFETFALGRTDTGIPYLINDWVSTEIEKRKNKKLLPNEIEFENHRGVLDNVFKVEAEMNASNFYTEFVIAYNSLFDLTTDRMSSNRARAFLEYYSNNGYLTAVKGKKNNEILYSINTEKHNEKFI